MRIFFISLLIFSFLKSNSQIDLQTGSAQYSIPVFNYTDPKSGLSHAVAINYNSGQGIKVNQLSSNVGLGWSLMAGGEIIRIQNGEPDDQYNIADMTPYTDATLSNFIYHSTNSTLYNNYTPNGYLYKSYDINYLPKQLAFQPRFYDGDDNLYRQSPKADEDTEQDMFILNLNGTIKTFKIGRNTFDVKYEDGSFLQTQIIKEANSDRTLSQQNITTKITGFKITDENGLIYTFDSYEKDELMKTVLNAYTKIQEQQGTGKYVINRWVLTSIKDPITNLSINFTYTAEEWKYISNVLGGSSTFVDNNNNTSTTVSNIFGVAHTFKQILSGITFPNQVQVNFAYSSTSRVDLDGSHALSDINILQNSQLIRNCHLQSQYFLGKSIVTGAGISQPFSGLTSTFMGVNYIDKLAVKNAYSYRLALTSIALVGKNNIPIRNSSFTYETGQSSTDPLDKVPSRFEYQNSAINVNNINLLWDYSLLYDKDLSRYGNEASAQMGILKRVDESTNISIDFTFKLNINEQGGLICPASYLLVDKITYTDKVANSVIVKHYEYSDQGSSYASPAYITTNESMGYGYSSFGLTFRRHQNETTTGTSGLKLNVSSIVKFAESEIKSALMDAVSAGSSKLLSLIRFLDFITQPGAFDSFLYNLFGWGDNELSCSSSTTSIEPVSSSNALPTQMYNVKEFDVIAGSPILSKQFLFSKSQNDVIGYSFPYPAWQRYDPGKIGNLSLINYFNNSGQIVYSKSLNYTFTKTVLDDNFLSVKYAVNHYYSDRRFEQPFTDSRIADSWITKASYNYATGRSFVSSTTETLANSANSANSTTTVNYSYDTKNNLPNQAYSTASDGKVKGSNSYYVVDYWNTYTSNTVLSKQKLNNMVNVPVATISWFKTNAASTSYNVTSVTITGYDPTTLKINSVKTSLFSQPVVLSQTDLSSFDPYSTSTSWLTSVSFTYLQQNTYDNNYMLVQSNLNDNSSVNSVVYDYNTYLPSAKISNSTYTDVSYSSFESANKDFWSYADAGVINDATSVTGSYLYNLSSGGNITRASLTASQNYQVTLWAKNGTVTINGSSGTSLIVKNGWTLYKFTFTGTTSLTITGTAYIDELRLYPSNAQMSTCTYNPLIGITSSCDENNTTTYNTYDDAGRLTLVMDANKNIIKKMCYNSLYASTACTDYGNAVQSGTFYGNCGCTNQNNAVSYTVPANTYHSSISQADADAQAMNDLTTNGQAYANAHPNCGSAISSQTFKYNNQTSDQICIKVYNVCTGTNVSGVNPLSVSAHTTGTIAQLPAGTYNIQAYSCSSGLSHSYHIDVPNFYSGTTATATISNVQFTATATLTIF